MCSARGLDVRESEYPSYWFIPVHSERSPYDINFMSLVFRDVTILRVHSLWLPAVYCEMLAAYSFQTVLYTFRILYLSNFIPRARETSPPPDHTKCSKLLDFRK